MNKTYLNKLEYNEILKILSNYCHTYIAKNMALNLVPSSTIDVVKSSLSQTMQGVSLIKRFGNIPISEIADVSVPLKSLESNVTLSISSILEIINIFTISKDLKKYFSQENMLLEDFSNLKEYISMLYSNTNIIEEISKCIIDQDTIADDASSSLKIIRNKKRDLEQDIKDNLNSFIHSSTNSKYIQEPIVTIRNGRYVIPVKEECRNNIRGFIHDISSSGSTIFVEPLSVFEMNNEINNLKVQESLEIEKILQHLSNLLAPYVNEIKADIEAIANLDFIFAKANYSIDINGITPSISNNKKIQLINARHPLINSNKVVPISVELGTNFSILVITGPNTGGKTVTLKTVGLLTAMACSGLNIPADEKSIIYVFDNIYADIGDDQSIATSLSTFSSHMINIVDIINNATPDSLILVDELGSGTDPLEGASLAISILEYFNKLDSLVLSTTHYQELKKYALVTDNFENASVEFDVQSLQPTYKLLIGIPGKSNAFDISKKLGLSQSIINRASSMLSSQDINIEDLLKNIYNNKIKIEKDKEETEKILKQNKMIKEKLEKELLNTQNKKQEIINNAKSEARQFLLNSKQEANKIINEMNKKATSSNSMADLNNLRNDLNYLIKSTSSTPAVSEPSQKPLSPKDIKPNATVFVTTYNQNGTVLSHISKSNEVQIQIGNVKANVNIKYLEEPKNINKSKTIPAKSNSFSKAISIKPEINVIGLNVEEANFAIDKFLDDCYLAKLKTVRIIHGKGTGTLRNGIHQFLKKHPHVKSFRIGTFGEGEMGATVVELKL